MLQQGTDLGPRRRLARAQENRHRLAALHMVDVHGQEAALIVVGVEERELLVAVHGIAGVVDIERDGGGRGWEGAAEEIDHAAVIRATMRDGAFSSRLMVGQSARPLSGARPEACLNRGSAQRVAVVGILVTAGDREHADQHGRERVDHLRLIAPVTDAACQGLGETQAALRLAQQDEAAVRRDQAAIEGGAHLLALDAWQIEGERAIVGHGGRGVLVGRRGRRSDNEFLPDGNALRYVRHPSNTTNNPG